MNLTKTVRKTPIDLELQHVGAAVGDESTHKEGGPKYDAEDMWVSGVVGVGWGVLGVGGLVV